MGFRFFSEVRIAPEMPGGLGALVLPQDGDEDAQRSAGYPCMAKQSEPVPASLCIK